MKARPKWHDAYDAQMSLWRWYRTSHSKLWIQNMWTVAMRGHAGNEGFRDLMIRLYDGEQGRLIDCDPIFVSGEMCELVAHAADSFEPEPLLETDLLTPRAFVWFEEPIVMRDRYDRELPIRAFSYGRDYVTSEDNIDEAMQVITNGPGPRVTVEELDRMVDEGLIRPYGLTLTLYADTGAYLETSKPKDGEIPGWIRVATANQGIVPFHITPWHFGQTFAGNDVDENGEPTAAEAWWRICQTTFRLMQQKIKPHGYGRTDRAQRREGQRLGFPPDTETVIVRLRVEEQPREHDEALGGTANYSHRFIRSGHWRNQWYPSEKLHRQIWIHPTVVGDPSLPLIVRPRRVYQWTR